MIRFVTLELEQAFVRSCNTIGVFETKIYSQYQTYGAQSGIVDFWLIYSGKTVIGVISGCGGRFTLAAHAIEDTHELKAFLSAAGAKIVEAERTLLYGIGTLCESGLILRADVPPPEHDRDVKPAESLTEVWELLCAADEEFAKSAHYDAWLAEFSHKVRHGLAECFTIRVGGQLAAASSILFKNSKCAVLAAVAAHPDFRGRGFGRRTVMEATTSAFAQGLSPAVFIRKPELQRFYAECGYHLDGEWGQAEVLPPKF